MLSFVFQKVSVSRWIGVWKGNRTFLGLCCALFYLQDRELRKDLAYKSENVTRNLYSNDCKALNTQKEFLFMLVKKSIWKKKKILDSAINLSLILNLVSTYKPFWDFLLLGIPTSCAGNFYWWPITVFHQTQLEIRFFLIWTFPPS